MRKNPKIRTVMYLGDRCEKFPSKVIKFDWIINFNFNKKIFKFVY